jgi:Domain of unknown function (DUF4913)
MTTTEAEGEEGPPEPGFSNCATWVAKWLCPNLEREIKRTFEWCPQWWDHPEAVQRLEALWRAWEFLRLEPGTGMSTWWVDHADAHLALLCNPDIGPFGHCHTTHGRDVATLRATEPPDDWPHWVTAPDTKSAPPRPRTSEASACGNRAEGRPDEPITSDGRGQHG